MKKETIKYIIQLVVAILTAIGSTLSRKTAPTARKPILKPRGSSALGFQLVLF